MLFTCYCRSHPRFPIDDFNGLRRLLDPKNIMANDYINTCLGDVEAE